MRGCEADNCARRNPSPVAFGDTLSLWERGYPTYAALRRSISSA
jgi:hypothetical protein